MKDFDYPTAHQTVGRIVFSPDTQRREFTDDELTYIYYAANPPVAGIPVPIPTQRILRAMRAMLELK